jgi:hypothetical protein
MITYNFNGTGADDFGLYWQYPVRMLKQPVVTTFCPNAANSHWSDGSTTTVTATDYNNTERGVFIYNSGAIGIQANVSYRIHILAVVEL